jgi:predicted ATP-binding protein involved in virulence
MRQPQANPRALEGWGEGHSANPPKLIIPMRIKQLRLKNFRGIKNLELNFDITQSVAVLVGINGIGKSSILDCIRALFRAYDLISGNIWLILPQVRVNPNHSNILGAFLNDHEDIFQDRDIYNGKDSSRNSISVMLQDKNEINWEVEKDKLHKHFGKMLHHDLELISGYVSGRYSEKYFVSVYYLVNRKPIKINKNFSSEETDVMDIIDFKEFTSWFQKLENLENETRLSIDNNHRDIKLEATRTAIYSMLGEGYSNLRMKRAIDKLTIYKADQEIELDWLSDGEKGLLALAGDLARRLAVTYPDSDDPLKEAGLVLIDEIELHLHPAWQRIIIQRLTQTFPGCQFIVTTHSPPVLSNVQPECIHVLALEDDNVVVKRPECSYGRDSNRILEDIMGVTKRPPEIEARILELFRVIHDGELQQAKEIIQNLASEIGIDEPELIRAASTIHRWEVIGR